MTGDGESARKAVVSKKNKSFCNTILLRKSSITTLSIQIFDED
jgi:hypothetical protein